MTAIKRIGVLVKPHQPDALETLCRLTEWLNEKGIQLVGQAEIAHEQIEHQTGCPVEIVKDDQLAPSVDLILVLGGDGTMISTARMIEDSEVPVIGVNYGGLGYLAEFPIEELFTALDSILSGQYKVQNGVMLAGEPVQRPRRYTPSRV